MKFHLGALTRVYGVEFVVSFFSDSRPLALKSPLKSLTKLAIILDYKCPGMLWLDLPARCKVLNLDFQSDFFSLRNKILGAHFLLELFLATSISKPLIF